MLEAHGKVILHKLCISVPDRPEEAGRWYMKVHVLQPEAMFSHHAYQWLHHRHITTVKHTVPDPLIFLTIPERGSLVYFPSRKRPLLSLFQRPDPVSMVEKKPRWWWRFLACIYYLRPLHETWWVSAEAAYHLHPVLEDLEFLMVPFRRAMSRLTYWFHIVVCLLIDTGLVRHKKLPHFLRFHVQMCQLVDIAMQVIAQVCYFLPFSVHMSKVGVRFWTAVPFAFILTVLECIRCGLAGMYADVPFVCDAAYFTCDLDL